MPGKKMVGKLKEKKHRIETGRFLVEGRKPILELLESDMAIEAIYATPLFLNEVRVQIERIGRSQNPPELISATPTELSRIGTLVTNEIGIAIVHIPEEKTMDDLLSHAQHGFILALDDVRDPGNLGTIIRTADWFGVSAIALSKTTTDPYAPKVVNATMGSFLRVSLSHVDLKDFLETAHRRGIPIMGAMLDGAPLRSAALPQSGILVMGSESHGIAPQHRKYLTHPLTIPRKGKAESLNVGIATGIFLAALAE